MFFLIRSAFWLSLVLLLIPFGASGGADNMPGPMQALMAARTAVVDIAGMCDRQPQVCEVGRNAVSTLVQRAQADARMLTRDDEAATASYEPVYPEVYPQVYPQDDSLTTGTIPGYGND